MKESTVQKLAAYSTIKALADSSKYKNQYYVLAEFIKYVITELHLYSFSVLDMIEVLKEEFDFSIPFAVCKASLKRINGLSRTGEEYTVNERELVSKDFEQINKDSLIDGEVLVKKLTAFALKDQEARKDEDKKWIELLEVEFIKYILDRQDAQDLQYGDLISRFCLSIENDSNLQRIIERIREGSILYCGLSYNIIETGSLSDSITFYLDTEILFYLAGYNGQLSQRIVLDLMDQVNRANKKGKKITLTYFNEVQEEIDRYFTAARNIVAGKGGVITSRAMASIVNGCEKESDVLNKQSDFYYLLENGYGVKPDKNKDVYYNEENYQYNLESQENAEDDNLKSEEAMRFISHINVLRKGIEFTDFMKSQFLIITETRKLIEVSDEQKPHGKIGYALPVNSMTNILWLKLGGVFGKGLFPSNVNIAVKARMALGRSISSNVNREYSQVVSQYKEGLIQEEQAIARLLRLQDKIIAPENISDANIDDLIDFSTESLQKYEEALRQRRIEEEKKDRIISDLESERKNNNETILELQKQNELKGSIIKEKENQLQEYIDKEKKEKQIKENNNRTTLYRLTAIAGIEIAIIIFVVLGFLPEGLLITKVFKGVVGVLGVLSGVCTIWPQANVFEKNVIGNKKHTTDKVNYSSLIVKRGFTDVVLLVIVLLLLYLMLKGVKFKLFLDKFMHFIYQYYSV